MNVNQYAFTGDPQTLLSAWERSMQGFSKEDFFLHVVSTRPDGITILDVCPSEADFQGWINGDDWRRIKADLGGVVEVTRLGEITTAIAREGVVEVTRPHAHSH